MKNIVQRTDFYCEEHNKSFESQKQLSGHIFGVHNRKTFARKAKRSLFYQYKRKRPPEPEPETEHVPQQESGSKRAKFCEKNPFNAIEREQDENGDKSIHIDILREEQLDLAKRNKEKNTNISSKKARVKYWNDQHDKTVSKTKNSCVNFTHEASVPLRLIEDGILIENTKITVEQNEKVLIEWRINEENSNIEIRMTFNGSFECGDVQLITPFVKDDPRYTEHLLGLGCKISKIKHIPGMKRVKQIKELGPLVRARDGFRFGPFKLVFSADDDVIRVLQIMKHGKEMFKIRCWLQTTDLNDNISGYRFPFIDHEDWYLEHLRKLGCQIELYHDNEWYECNSQAVAKSFK